MYGTGENFASNVVPFQELALMYLEKNLTKSKKPEAYVAEYIKTFHEMQNAFFTEKEHYALQVALTTEN